MPGDCGPCGEPNHFHNISSEFQHTSHQMSKSRGMQLISGQKLFSLWRNKQSPQKGVVSPGDILGCAFSTSPLIIDQIKWFFLCKPHLYNCHKDVWVYNQLFIEKRERNIQVCMGDFVPCFGPVLRGKRGF